MPDAPTQITVRCRYCNTSGAVELHLIGATRFQVLDHIQHKPGCPAEDLTKLATPKHFKEKRWVTQETRFNNLIGARATVASGAVHSDFDGRTLRALRTECKGTAKGSWRLRQSYWTRFVREALSNGEEPVLHVEFALTGPHYFRRVLIRRDWYANFQREPGEILSVGVAGSSHRVLPMEPPRLVLLNPVGVDLSEAHFFDFFNCERQAHG